MNERFWRHVPLDPRRPRTASITFVSLVYRLAKSCLPAQLSSWPLQLSVAVFFAASSAAEMHVIHLGSVDDPGIPQEQGETSDGI